MREPPPRPGGTGGPSSGSESLQMQYVKLDLYCYTKED